MNDDASLPFDLQEILDAIDETDVAVIGFPLFPERMMADFRFSDQGGPMIRMVAPVGSRAERMRDLMKLRPEFGMPAQHIFFVWPRSVSSFRESDIWKQIVSKLAGIERHDSTEQCKSLLDDLKGLERKALVDAIRGESYQSLWERTG